MMVVAYHLCFGTWLAHGPHGQHGFRLKLPRVQFSFKTRTPAAMGC